MSDHRCGTETCLAMAVVDIPLAHHSSLGRARDHLHTAEELHGRKPRDRLPRGLDGVAAAVELVDVPVTVMVVLDACTDHSEEVIPQWVHVLSVSARNVGAARAAGFLAAAPAADPGTWLATTDADCVVPERWLVKQVNHHAAAVESAVGTVVVDWRVSYTDTA